MIRGYWREAGNQRRPFVVARVSLPVQNRAGEVHFLVDTGADTTVLAPRDASRLRIALGQLPPGPPSAGVGGRVNTVEAAAVLTLDAYTRGVALRMLVPREPGQAQVLARIPSLLGRDVLRHFALIIEERTSRVLLLEPHEADALHLP